jgi:hypothetical protein
LTIAKNFDLIGATLLAGDSSKFRAQNSKKNNFNKKKVKRHQAYIEEKLKQYNELVENGEAQAEVAKLTQQINKH